MAILRGVFWLEWVVRRFGSVIGGPNSSRSPVDATRQDVDTSLPSKSGGRKYWMLVLTSSCLRFAGTILIARGTTTKSFGDFQDSIRFPQRSAAKFMS